MGYAMRCAARRHALRAFRRAERARAMIVIFRLIAEYQMIFSSGFLSSHIFSIIAATIFFIFFMFQYAAIQVFTADVSWHFRRYHHGHDSTFTPFSMYCDFDAIS